MVTTEAAERALSEEGIERATFVANASRGVARHEGSEFGLHVIHRSLGSEVIDDGAIAFNVIKIDETTSATSERVDAVGISTDSLSTAPERPHWV